MKTKPSGLRLMDFAQISNMDLNVLSPNSKSGNILSLKDVDYILNNRTSSQPNIHDYTNKSTKMSQSKLYKNKSKVSIRSLNDQINDKYKTRYTNTGLKTNVKLETRKVKDNTISTAAESKKALGKNINKNISQILKRKNSLNCFKKILKSKQPESPLNSLRNSKNKVRNLKTFTSPCITKDQPNMSNNFIDYAQKLS